MRYKNMGTSFFRFVTIHAFGRQTDGRTDISLVAKSALHRCSAVKIHSLDYKTIEYILYIVLCVCVYHDIG